MSTPHCVATSHSGQVRSGSAHRFDTAWARPPRSPARSTLPYLAAVAGGARRAPPQRKMPRPPAQNRWVGEGSEAAEGGRRDGFSFRRRINGARCPSYRLFCSLWVQQSNRLLRHFPKTKNVSLCISPRPSSLCSLLFRAQKENRAPPPSALSQVGPAWWVANTIPSQKCIRSVGNGHW